MSIKRVFPKPILPLGLAAAAALPLAVLAGTVERVDVAIVGAGIVSTHVAALISEMDPSITMAVYERLDHAGLESSDTLNNAGTGHGALAESNYTPELDDGTIDISKAIAINESFEVTKEFWATLTERGHLGDPGQFIHSVPHESWMHGPKDVSFLRRRYQAMKKHFLFSDMEYTESHEVMAQWMPVIAEGRAPTEVMAATRSLQGTDVDFGRLTRLLYEHLSRSRGVPFYFGQEVGDISRNDDGTWSMQVTNKATAETTTVIAKKVFIGAGGGTLPLLQRSGIPEAKGYGGFPIGGQFLVTQNPEIVDRHFGKVYSKAKDGAPPMSVPHMDTRVINGQRLVVIGPYATATTKFLKAGSIWDLIGSVTPSNLGTLLSTAIHEFPLVSYLLGEATQTHEQRMEVVRKFIPGARSEDWTLIDAGQRVQVLKNDHNDKPVLRMGTEYVDSEDGSIGGLLGASPGASVSGTIALSVVESMFRTELTPARRENIKRLIPSYGLKLSESEHLTRAVRHWTNLVLGLVEVGQGESTNASGCRTNLEPAGPRGVQ